VVDAEAVLLELFPDFSTSTESVLLADAGHAQRWRRMTTAARGLQRVFGRRERLSATLAELRSSPEATFKSAAQALETMPRAFDLIEAATKRELAELPGLEVFESDTLADLCATSTALAAQAAETAVLRGLLPMLRRSATRGGLAVIRQNNARRTTAAAADVLDLDARIARALNEAAPEAPTLWRGARGRGGAGLPGVLPESLAGWVGRLAACGDDEAAVVAMALEPPAAVRSGGAGDPAITSDDQLRAAVEGSGPPGRNAGATAGAAAEGLAPLTPSLAFDQADVSRLHDALRGASAASVPGREAATEAAVRAACDEAVAAAGSVSVLDAASLTTKDTALLLAARMACAPAVRAVVAAGANPCVGGLDFQTAWHAAVGGAAREQGRLACDVIGVLRELSAPAAAAMSAAPESPPTAAAPTLAGLINAGASASTGTPLRRAAFVVDLRAAVRVSAALVRAGADCSLGLDSLRALLAAMPAAAARAPALAAAPAEAGTASQAGLAAEAPAAAAPSAGMASFYGSAALSDCVVAVTTPTGAVDIPAHRVVLAAASPYFRALFTDGGTAARKWADGARVDATGYPEHAARAALAHMYGAQPLRGVAALDASEAFGLAELADAWLLDGLWAEAGSALIAMMTEDTAAHALELAVATGRRGLAVQAAIVLLGAAVRGGVPSESVAGALDALADLLPAA